MTSTHASSQVVVLQTAEPAPPSDELNLTRALSALPVRGSRIMLAGASILMLGVLLYAVSPPASLVFWLAHLAPLGLGSAVVVLGLMKRVVERRELRAAEQRRDAALAGHAERVRGLLGEPRPEQTVEWIAAKLGLDESTVVRSLDRLRRRSEIEEELNTETGDWYYFASSRQLEAGGRDLEARMAALKTRRTE